MKKSIFAADTPRATGKSSGDTPTKPGAAASRKSATSTVALRPSLLAGNASSKPVAKKREEMETKLEEHEELSDAFEDDDEDDLEYEALLGRKIEETPAAKVIVSDEMMREALSEMKARKSINLGIPSSIRVDGNSDQGLPTASSMTHSGGAGDGKHIGEGQTPLQSPFGEICVDSSGCPLEKVFEFLQALMTKNYKIALELAKEIQEHEPDNETVKEYMSVLNEYVNVENTESESDSSTDESSEEENEFSEELSTSSETDSNTEEDESSGDSSSTSSDDEDEETSKDEGKLQLGNSKVMTSKGSKTLGKVGSLKGNTVRKTLGVDSSAVSKSPST
ncbi:unnamed protein product [Orchesella dallaii]|uniref:Glutamate-rich protein 2 n=1 Tax=Orchesella dallaii TaxID=48710 RepID=A0ABP1S4P7_9HEXA